MAAITQQQLFPLVHMVKMMTPTNAANKMSNSGSGGGAAATVSTTATAPPPPELNEVRNVWN